MDGSDKWQMTSDKQEKKRQDIVFKRFILSGLLPLYKIFSLDYRRSIRPRPPQEESENTISCLFNHEFLNNLTSPKTKILRTQES